MWISIVMKRQTHWRMLLIVFNRNKCRIKHLFRLNFTHTQSNFKCTKGIHTSSAKSYNSIIFEIPRVSRFSNSNLSTFYAMSFARLSFGHDRRLLAHFFYLNLNCTCLCPFHPLYDTHDIGDFRHIFFHCP